MIISWKMIPEPESLGGTTARKLAEQNTAFAVSFGRLAASGNAVADPERLGPTPQSVVEAYKIEGAGDATESAARAAYLIGSEPSVLTLSQATMFSPTVRGLLESL